MSKKPNNSAEKKVKNEAKELTLKQHLVTVVMTDKKTKFQILTSWGKEGDVLNLDIDPKNHPAWQDKSQTFVNVSDARVTKFNDKFGGFNSF